MRLESIREISQTGQSLHPYDENIVYVGTASAVFTANETYKRGMYVSFTNESDYNFQVNINLFGATSITLLPSEGFTAQFKATGFV